MVNSPLGVIRRKFGDLYPVRLKSGRWPFAELDADNPCVFLHITYLVLVRGSFYYDVNCQSYVLFVICKLLVDSVKSVILWFSRCWVVVLFEAFLNKLLVK